MLRQMSGPTGVHAQFPVGRAGRAVPVSVPLPRTPPSAPDPCERTGHVTTQLFVLVSLIPSLLTVSMKRGEKSKAECEGQSVNTAKAIFC